MESSTTYNIKFELFKISEADYNAQVEADNTPQFDRIGEKKLAYNIDRSLGELLISNYGGNNIASFVDQFLTDYKYQHFLSCSRDCYLVTNKYNGSIDPVKKKVNERAEMFNTPVLLPITNLTGTRSNSSIVSYRSTLSQVKPYSMWIENNEMETIWRTNDPNGFIWIQIYLICGETAQSSSSRYSGRNTLEDYENDLAEESGIIIDEPQPEPEDESDDTSDEEGYNPARARRVAQIRRQQHNALADRALRGDIQSYSSRRSNRSRGPFCFRRRGGKSKKHKKSTKKSKKHRKR